MTNNIQNDLLEIEQILGSIPEYDPNEGNQDVSSAESWDAHCQLMIEKLPLPDFVVVPEPKKLYVATFKHDDENGEFEIIVTDDSNGKVIFNDFGEDGLMRLYKYSPKKDGQIVFREGTEDIVTEGFLGYEINLPQFKHVSWMNLSRFYYTSRPYIDYWKFLKATKTYLEDPKDFYNAYFWVRFHPIFWTNNKQGDTETNNGYNFYHSITKRDNGSVVHMAEAGEARPPLRQDHSHDINLDAYGNTYEECVVNLAALINKYFKFDGSRREDVPDYFQL